jgi:hypothetical protein
LDKFASLDKERYYLFIYIKQAHSEDWPIGEWSNLPQPKNFQERVKRGYELKKKLGIQMPMLFDTMDDSFNNIAKAWPIRMYIIGEPGIVQYIEPDPVDGIESTTRLQNLQRFINK